MRSGPHVSYERELVESHEGQHINMDYLYPLLSSTPTSSAAATAAAAPVSGITGPAKGRSPQAKGLMFIVPGLLNASTTNYVRHFAAKCVEASFAVCVLNSRGMGTTPLEVPQLFSATFTEDIRHCLHHYLQQKQVQGRLGHPAARPPHRSRLLARRRNVNQSTSASRACQPQKKSDGRAYRRTAWRRTHPSLPPSLSLCVCAFVTVTPPYDLIEADRMSATPLYRRLYEKAFGTGLQKHVKHNRKMLAKLPGVDRRLLFEGPNLAIDHISSIRAFDTYISASHNGFNSPQAYYVAAQPLVWLPRCHTPILCVGNRNDFVAGDFVPDASWRALVDKNLYTVYVCYPVGGHLGFLGTPAAEWRGDASEAERLVLRAATNFCETAP
uniref:AB hydrolase-1 domain-containing protein n=1 Tax=Leishmania guyanensis TaxID=5670 RepID=A0A1E1IQW3_LEIGU|nr:hypothetical protein, conserved [Leishmania guyanensis]